MTDTMSTDPKIEWKEDVTSEIWNHILSTFHGHPLQSTHWGDARKQVDNITDHRWVASQNNQPIMLVRFEERYLFNFIKIAWIPKGPVTSEGIDSTFLLKKLNSHLRKKGYFLCVTNPWHKKINPKKSPSNYTIWLDLNIGKEALWKNLDKQFRYDVKRAIKESTVVEQVKTRNDVEAFYQLCDVISHKKGFHLKASTELMMTLLHHPFHADIESTLFVVKHKNTVCAGAFIIRCGENIHYLWGAVDRNHSKLRAGEAIQWHVIEWALAKNCKKYDLEGIDLKNNPGTYHFKKKLGGEVIGLPKEQLYLVHPLFKPFSIFYRVFISLKYQWQKVVDRKYVPV